MVNRLVSVGDDFTLPAAVKAADVNLPTRLGATALNATILDKGSEAFAPTGNDPFRHDKTRLRTFRAALAKRDTTPVDVLMIGDSITEGQGQSGTSPVAGKRWADRFRDALRSAWQPAGVAGGYGYVPASWATSGYTNPITYTGTGTSGTQTGSGLGNIRRSSGPDVAINKYFTGTGIDIVYMKNSQGTDVTWEIDSGARTTFNTYAATSVSGQTIQIRGLTPGQHLITLRVVGPNNFYFNGFMEYNGDETKGIRTWAGGRSGYRSLDFITTNERVYEDYGLVNPDLVNIALGTNDYVTSQVVNKQTPAQMRTNLETLLAAVRAKCTVPPSVIMWLPAEVKGVANALAPWAEYLAAIEAMAKADGAITLFDANTLMGDQGVDALGLLTVDKIHPNDTGYQALADSLTALVHSATGSASYANKDNGGLVTGQPGKKFRTVAVPLRNVGAPNYWQPIVDAAHAPYGVASVATSPSTIDITFDFTASKICSLVACPDETLSNYGYSMGASVSTTGAILTMRRHEYTDYISYNGSAWVSSTGKTAIDSYTAGELLLTHPEVGGSGASATGRDGGFIPQLGSLTSTQTRIKFYDWAGVLQTTPTTGMKVFLTRSAGEPAINPQNVAPANSNIWVYGVFEV